MLERQAVDIDNGSKLEKFERDLRVQQNPREFLANHILGKKTKFRGPFGEKEILYADYIASGRALKLVEDFVLEEVLPFYANSHTEASFCGATMTRMREEARELILKECGGNQSEHALIFAGSGATSALNKLPHLFGLVDALNAGKRVTVFIGPYEHHSNILPWREIGAQVVEIAEGPSGGPSIELLTAKLAELDPDTRIVGAFSAASNVTGFLTDIESVSRPIKERGGLVVWDYACGAPYLPMDMSPDGIDIDAIVFSPHKFLGGPGASGVLIVRRDAVYAQTPHRPGGGTVAFVNGQVHDYLKRLEEREEGGTPNIVGDIRAALVMIVKRVMGQDFINNRHRWLVKKALEVFNHKNRIQLLGDARADRLPVFSLVVSSCDGSIFDYQLFTRALSDIYGIQVRGGCACAGPYVHRLMKIDSDWSSQLRTRILAGDESHKPGFVRLNLSALLTDEEVDYVLECVASLAKNFEKIGSRYQSAPSDRSATAPVQKSNILNRILRSLRRDENGEASQKKVSLF